MKKLIILLLFLSQISFGQSLNRQLVGLSAGPSFPLDDFARKELNDSTSGFAKTGIALTFNYAYRITHNFGLQLIINYSGNSLDKASYKNQLEEEHHEYRVSVESNQNWSSGGMFLGPYLRFPITERLSWDIRALAGYFGSYSPNITIFTTKKDDLNEKGEYYLASSHAYSFGYILGTGLKYRMDSYYVLLFGDYVNSSIEYKDATGWDWDGEPYTTTFKQRINYLSVTVGVGYIL